MKYLKFIVLTALTLLLSSCAVSVTETMIVSPSKEINTTHQSALLKKYAEVNLQTADGTEIYALQKHNPNVDTTILVLHGNALNLTLQPWYGLLERLGEAKYNVLAIDYRGFGLSDGIASFTNMKEDARTALAFINKQQKVFVYGLSLGSYLAAESANAPNVQGIIVEGGITNHQEMMELYQSRKMFGAMVDIQLDNRLYFDTTDKISNNDKPVLVIHGKQDQNIPVSMGRSLFNASSNENSQWVLVENGRHCDSFLQMKGDFLPLLDSFVQKNRS